MLKASDIVNRLMALKDRYFQGLSWPHVKLDIFPTYLRSEILLIEVADTAKCVEDGLI